MTKTLKKTPKTLVADDVPENQYALEKAAVALPADNETFEYRLKELSREFAGKKIELLLEIVGQNMMVEAHLKLKEQLYYMQKLASAGKLKGGGLYDLNTILTAILSHLQLALLELPYNTVNIHIGTIIEGTERVLKMTKELLVFSRKQAITLKPHDVNDIIKNSESFLVGMVWRTVAFEFTLAEKECMVMADRGQIGQVLMNLVLNAKDAMPYGGVIGINTGVIPLSETFTKSYGYGNAGSYVHVAFSDTGMGMDAKTLENAFEPLFTTKAIGKGTGLGLSVVYDIVKQHNGFIDVKSSPGKVSTVNMYFPLINDVAGKCARPSEPLVARVQDTAPGDDEYVRSFRKQML